MDAPTPSPLADALAKLAPDGCTVGVLPIDARYVDVLHDAELRLVGQARPTRLAEFATGRALLHRLLPHSGELLRLPNGAVAFPPESVGSLAHDRVHAVAVVAASSDYLALGVDIEQHVDSDDELVAAVLRDDDPEVAPIAAFVMKEAAFKAWSSLGGPLLEPLQVRLEMHPDALLADAGAFAAHTAHAASVHGRCIRVADTWLAIAAVPRR